MFYGMLAQTAPEDTRIARFIFDRIGTSVEAFINEGSSTMITLIGPAAAACLTIYVLLWGAGIAAGQISEPFTDGMKRIIRMSVIVALALTAGIYQSSVADFFRQAPMELASQMVIPGSTPTGGDVDGMAKLLDDCLAKGFEVAQKPWDLGDASNAQGVVGITGEGLAFQGLSILLYVIAVITVAVAAGLIFVAYMSMAILLAIGPLFILLALFPATQRWFEAWLGQVVNYAVMFLLVAVSSALLFKMLDVLYSDLAIATLPETLIATLKALGVSIAMIGVLLQMNSVAGALGGGAQASVQGMAGRFAMAGAGAVGAARGTALGTKGAARGAASAARGAARGIKQGTRALAMARRRFKRNSISAE